MLNSIQLENKAQELFIEASGEKKSNVANEIKAFAFAMRDFAGMVKNGIPEIYFQKTLTKTESRLNQFLETYNEYKEINTVQDKEYAKLHHLHELELSCKYLRFLLGIKHTSVL